MNKIGYTFNNWLKSAKNLNGAEKQMSFQSAMSGSAHQREIEDLKKAGLNPVLSAGGSGASTPTGALDESAGSDSSSGSYRIVKKAVDNSAKTVNKTVKELGDAVKEVSDIAKYDRSDRRREHAGDTQDAEKIALNLLNALPIDRKPQPSVTGRSLVNPETRYKLNRATFQDMKDAFEKETGKKWYDRPPYLGKMSTSWAGKIFNMIGFLPNVLNSSYTAQKNWIRQFKYWKHLSDSEKKNYQYWIHQNQA